MGTKLYAYAFLCFFLLLSCTAFAQLSADFSMDNSSGCAPLAVRFFNKTTGASPNARYTWDFGNGNTSTLQSPAATYRNEQSYTVTLTVKDGGQTSIKKATVIVFKKPVVDFSPSVLKGCQPLQVDFTSKAQAGDGTIAEYVWDFGNGNVVKGADMASTAHTYNHAQTASVSLAVTNSHGCYTVVEKPGLLEIYGPVKAAFSVNKKALCQTGESVQFSNTSEGPGTLSYLWDFGDGNTSTQAAPSHVYKEKGSYTVKLKVTSSKGCADELIQSDLVHVANFNSSIQMPQVVCSGTALSFTAQNSPVADSVLWNFGPDVPEAKTVTAQPVFTVLGKRTITLTSYWGGCVKKVVKEIVVKESPSLKGFLYSLPVSCRVPFTVQLEDTSKNAVKWQWQTPGQLSKSGSKAAITFNEYGKHPVTLTIGNEAGCTASVTEAIPVAAPAVRIAVAATSSRFGTADCIGLKVKFKVTGNTPLSSYRWNFGDGGTATDASPEYTFRKPGRYNVVLQYVTASGCTDTAVYREVAVYSKPKIDFTGPQEVCSSNPVGFKVTSDTAVRRYYWYFGDNGAPDTVTNSNNYIEHKYMQEGLYTVTVIANTGVCADTVVKKDFIKVNPPFQYKYEVTPECAPERNKVNFRLYTRGVAKLVWNFGDGVIDTIENNEWQKVFNTAHVFDKPGVYDVNFSSIQGNCIARDSVKVYIPGKQVPVLSASKAFYCLNDSIEATISGVTPLNVGSAESQYGQFKLKELRYNDGELFTGTVKILNKDWTKGLRILLHGFDARKSGLKAHIVSNITGCVDSSAVLPIRMSGPVAAIKAPVPVCLKDLAVFHDASKGNINQWQWKVGDVSLPVRTTSDSVLWRFNLPGDYPVSLKVTDVDGCSSTASLSNGFRVLGAKANFQLPDTLVAINTQVRFTNTSKALPGTTVQYTWTYSNGSKSSHSTNLEHKYAEIGRDTIQLIARTTEGGCADTLAQSLMADNIHAKFTYTAAYINNNACPPMLVKFVNLSRNSRSTLWLFGDGSSARNMNNPEHIYRIGGTYRVVLYTYGPNNIVDSASEEITVRGPSASIKADKYFGCLNQRVTLSAQVNYAKDYYWDYGDGTLLRTRTTSAQHDYLTAGVYMPALILTDSTGCSVAAELAHPIVIDSLSIAIKGIPPLICDSASIMFTTKATSLAIDRMGEKLGYNWKFGTAASALPSPKHSFAGEGRYPVQVTATSPYGCVQTAYDTVVVQRTVKGSIIGPRQVCADKEVGFSAEVHAAAATWKWLMPGGQTGTALQSPVQTYKDSGLYPVKLAVSHNGCRDTTLVQLKVEGRPSIRFAKPVENICRGNSVKLQASGGVNYQWSSDGEIVRDGQTATPLVAPTEDNWYRVLVKSAFGCERSDSVLVKVVQPFKLSVQPQLEVCSGSVVELKAAGATYYSWSGPAQSLMSTQGATVTARSLSDAEYVVTGVDSARCFTDVANIKVKALPLPTVKTGPDLVLLTGSEAKLLAKASTDVQEYQWGPVDYLSCTNCPQPVAQPRKPIAYTVSVRNNNGCIARDTINISLQCTDTRIFIPNAFTPDGDGLNETFSIKTKGIAEIRSFLIYDRWGGVVFQSGNSSPEDRKTAWDGTIGGRKAPVGTYVYVAELVCDTGEPILKKGTVTLIR